VKLGAVMGLAAGAALAGVVIGAASGRRGRRGRRPLGEVRHAEHAPKAIQPELEDAEARARAAGARGELTYIGAGMEGIVLCDEAGVAFKVARGGSLRDEAEWLQMAARIPNIKQHVPRGVRYDDEHRVLVRECVKPQNDGRRVNEKRLFELFRRMASTMETYGYMKPEYKPDAFVMARGRGPVLVDAGFTGRRGRPLVRQALALLKQRDPKPQDMRDMAFALRWERGSTIPEATANRILRRMQEIEPSVEL